MTDYLEPKYPLFLDIRGKQTVVVGAGRVAERKIVSLLEYGARVRVIAPVATAEIQAWAASDRIVMTLRPYQPGDLGDAFLVICATDDHSVNKQVFAEAEQNHTLVNVVDVPQLSNFILPAVVKRGPLQIAISTSGAAPAVAKHIRADLEESFGPTWPAYLGLLGELRGLVLERVPGKAAVRQPIFEIIASSDLYQRLLAGENISAQQAYDEIVTPYLSQTGSR